ncbi:MAG: hypothetical protein J5518_11455 [Lachnospiraceae bacterium]|nr:hypothetical protein [Lachnospiraceae bacterium]
MASRKYVKERTFSYSFHTFSKYTDGKSVIYTDNNMPIDKPFIKLSKGEITIYQNHALSENGIDVKEITFESSEISKFKISNGGSVIVSDLLPHGKTACISIPKEMYSDIKSYIKPSGTRGMVLKALWIFTGLAVLFLLGILLYTTINAPRGSSGASGSPETVTCQSCGRSFQIDSENAKSINHTNMCINCYTNFETATDALRELPVK